MQARNRASELSALKLARTVTSVVPEGPRIRQVDRACLPEPTIQGISFKSEIAFGDTYFSSSGLATRTANASVILRIT
jgi:hypothetical protein